MPNFRDIADKKPEDVAPVPVPPAGTYLFKVTKLGDIRDVKSEKGEWEAVEYSCKAVAPTEDVDADALRDYGKVDSILNRVSFMFDKNDETAFIQTENSHKRFLQDHLKCWPDGTSLKEAMAQAVGRQFLGTITWKPDNRDNSIIRANISKTAPAS